MVIAEPSDVATLLERFLLPSAPAALVIEVRRYLEESRQFQVYSGDTPQIWSVAIGTRHLERAHERCVASGIPCTEMHLVPWGENQGIRAFFAEVGGIVFEVLRVEASP